MKKAGTIYVAGVGVAVIVTVFSVWCYTRTYSGRESRLAAVGLLTLYAAAATLAGALVGFLFGVPRHVVVLTAADGSSIPQSAARLSVSKDGNAPNTNLEQISDWLTKILVGATLVQLERIPPAASALFSSLAAAVDSDFRCKAFVGALVTYSGIAGFIVGWLTTRVWIGRLLCMVDHADGADS